MQPSRTITSLNHKPLADVLALLPESYRLVGTLSVDTSTDDGSVTKLFRVRIDLEWFETQEDLTSTDTPR